MNLTILFGSQTGVAEEVAESIGAYSIACGASRCSVLPMDSVAIEDWSGLSPILFVCSTTGQGDPPKTMRASWDVLRMNDAPELSTLRYAVFGLGDSSYAKYNFLGKMLHNRLKQLGAHPLVHRGLGDDQDGGGLFEGLRPWLAQLLAVLELDSSRFPLGMASSPPILKYVVSPVSNSEPFGSAHKPHRLERTETLSVLSNTRITSQDHFQAVHHIELECSEPKFVCGDALGVYPPNSICAATEIAAHCNLQLTDRIKVESASQRTGLWIAPSPFLGTTMTVAELLTTYFDLESCASRTFLQTMKHFTHDEEELERLTELSSETRQEDYLAYCYREKRSAMEVLSEFPSCRVPFDFLVSNLKPLRPRYFSISSSPSADKKCIALTVARLEFATPYRRKRTGVCSSYLCAVAVDQKVECFVEKSPQPLPLHDCSRPLILVGPGTGIAPIRSVLREVATIGWKAPIHLFVGCRSPDKDFLYAAEWQGLKNRIGLHVHTAFSRMEGNKTYVQHRIVQADVAQPLSELLSCDPVIYVCGNSKQMPRDVETAITSVVQYYLLKGSEDGARQYIKQCKSEGRYVTDTWSS